MTFLAHVDGQRWRAQLDQVLLQQDDRAAGGVVVPVIKSNGYGLGAGFLCEELAPHQRGIVAVGTPQEALDPEFAWDRDVLVLTPWQVADTAAQPVWGRAFARHGDRLVCTIADEASLRAVARVATPSAPRRIVLEGLTPVQRFGFTQEAMQVALEDQVVASAAACGALRLAGLALHLPMVAPDAPPTGAGKQFGPDPATEPAAAGGARVRVAAQWGLWWLSLVARLGQRLEQRMDLSGAADLWVSHLGTAELGALRQALPDVPVHPRVGTALWLGDAGSVQAAGVALAVHPWSAGGAGYFQRRLPKGASLVVVGGGTSHGVALSGPIGNVSLRRRATTAGTGLLEAAGRSLSPFRLGGQRLWFHEAPHASVSLLVVPKGVVPPVVGEELPCQIRFTTARFDVVLPR